MRATNIKNLLPASFLILALGYLSIPARADVNIIITDIDMCDGELVLSFDARSEPNLVRAFALDIRTNNNAKIIDVTLLSDDYTIFPGTITIDSQGNVTDYGSPVAPQSDLPEGTLPGLDSNGVTIELASLYSPVDVGSPNAPDPCGPLVSIRIDRAFCLTITPNTARAGPTGVVMESPDEVITVHLPQVYCPTGCGCYYYEEPDSEQWMLVGMPECWCYPRQCLGDADGLPYGKQNYYVSIPDLTVLKAAWNKPVAEILGVTEPTTGMPLACADFDHLPYGKHQYRVSIPDLAILKANWNIAGGPSPVCQPGNETPP